MGLGRIFVAQGQFGPAQGLGHFWNLTFGPGPGLDFLALGWALGQIEHAVIQVLQYKARVISCSKLSRLKVDEAKISKE